MRRPFALAFLVLTGLSIGGAAQVAQSRIAPAKAARAFAGDMERLYLHGQRDAADARIAGTEASEGGFQVAAFDALPPGVEARAILRRERSGQFAGDTPATPPGYSYGGHEQLELTVLCSRPLASPLVVTFPPGSYGVGTERMRRMRHGNERRCEPATAQDLAFLRASVIVVEGGRCAASSAVPIACANFGGAPPLPDEEFPLARFPRDSAVDRLLCKICAGEPVDDRVAQLAVWVVRNDIAPTDLVRNGRPLLTFGRNVPVEVDNADDAAALLRSTGFEVEKARFYQQLAPVPAPARRQQDGQSIPLAVATS